jgi:hypothetical protein
MTALLVLVPWFNNLLTSLDSFIVQRPPGRLAALGPANDWEPDAYAMYLSVVLFVFGLGWYRLVRRRGERREHGHSTSVVGGLVLMVLTLFLLVLPYRIFRHNQHERVLYASQPCYLVAERDTQALLFCPTQPPPWNRIVPADDPALERTGTIERIFSEVDRPP